MTPLGELTLAVRRYRDAIANNDPFMVEVQRENIEQISSSALVVMAVVDLNAKLDSWPEITAVLAAHQRHGTGMTGGSADTCACGERIPPAPRSDGWVGPIMERRDVAMAQHQADELRKAVDA